MKTYWTTPPDIKIYEALGSVADKRVQLTDDKKGAQVYSSSGNKYYTVSYDPDAKALMVNDNGSYWKGYLGYPAIAYLMMIEVLPYNESYGAALSGIPWKDINQKHKNNFEKTKEDIHAILEKKSMDMKEFTTFVSSVLSEIETLHLVHLGKKQKPPSGY